MKGYWQYCLIGMIVIAGVSAVLHTVPLADLLKITVICFAALALSEDS